MRSLSKTSPRTTKEVQEKKSDEKFLRVASLKDPRESKIWQLQSEEVWSGMGSVEGQQPRKHFPKGNKRAMTGLNSAETGININWKKNNKTIIDWRLLSAEAILFQKIVLFFHCVHISCIYWLLLNKDNEKHISMITKTPPLFKKKFFLDYFFISDTLKTFT